MSPFFLPRLNQRVIRLFLSGLLVCLASPMLAHSQAVTQPFTFNLVGQDLPVVRHGSISWGDVDGDGDLDAFVSGSANQDIVTGLYLNQGLGADGTKHFALTSSSLTSVTYSFSSFADVDGDGDLDLLVGGSTTSEWPYTSATRLYRNDGGVFSAISGSGLPDLHSGTIAWGDIDADGDLDLVLSGVASSDAFLTVVAKNKGDGTFETDEDMIPGIGYGDADMADVDGDLDLDLVISGASENGFVTLFMRNDAGSFSDTGANLPGYTFSSVDLGDFDGDGDPDLVISGGLVSELIFEGNLNIYRNEGGTFADTDFDFDGVLAGDVTWGDYDHDGDSDLLLIGAEAALGRRTARIIRNDGSAGFATATLLVGAIFSDAEWGDFDADGDLDLLTIGSTSYGPNVTNLYENQRQVIPALPSAPSSLISDVTASRIVLSWLPASTADVTNVHVTFNVRVGTAPGASDVVSAMADATTGRLLKNTTGNASADGFLLEGLADGTYYWSVQTVNSAFLASSFAAEGSFSVSNSYSVASEDDTVVPREFAVYPNYPNPFSERTTFRFDLPEAANVQVRIFSILGQEVSVEAWGVLPAGQHQMDWDGTTRSGSQMGSGIYFYEVRAGQQAFTGTMTLVR